MIILQQPETEALATTETETEVMAGTDAAVETDTEETVETETEETVETETETSVTQGQRKKSRLGSNYLIIILTAAVLVILCILAVLFFIEAKLEPVGESKEINVFEQYTDEGVKATFLGIDISKFVYSVSNVNTDVLGEYTVDYSMKFLFRGYEAFRTVTVKDMVPPLITLVGEKEITLSDMKFYEEAGFSAEDNYDGDVSALVTVESAETEEECIITYKATDSSGNVSTAERIVVLCDRVPPSLTLNGKAEMNVDEAVFDDPGCTAIDDVDGDISSLVQVTTDYKEKTIGTFTFTYSVTDFSGNTATAKRIIHVRDKTPPEIKLKNGGAINIYVGTNTAEPGYAAIDGFDGNLTSRVKVEGSVDSSVPGTYTITYTVTDNSGNTAVANRVYTIIAKPDTSRVIRAPYIDQTVKYPNGCESVSTVMALQYLGMDISVEMFIDSFLDKGPKPNWYTGIGADPNLEYGGDPYSSQGWGCWSPVIMNALNKFIPASGYTATELKGHSLEYLCHTYIDNEIPVILWATVDMTTDRSEKQWASWSSPEGNPVKYYRKSHCLLLVGYDELYYYFNDPLSRGSGDDFKPYPKEKVEIAYSILNKQAIVITK